MWPQRNPHRRATVSAHLVGNAGAFLTEQQYVVGSKHKVVKPPCALARQQNHPRLPLDKKRVPIHMASQCDMIDIIHPGALEPLVRKGKSAGFNDIDTNAKTSGQPQDCTKVSGNFGLIDCQAHGGGLPCRDSAHKPDELLGCILSQDRYSAQKTMGTSLDRAVFRGKQVCRAGGPVKVIPPAHWAG